MTKQSIFFSPMIAILLTGLMVFAFTSAVSAEEKQSEKGYEFHPTPHHLDYGKGELSLKKDFQVVYDDTIDDVTKEKVTAIFADNNLPEPEVADQPANDKINIFVGTDGSDGPAEKNAEKHFTSDDMDFDEIDAYHLEVGDDAISIIGKDTDAAFYGVSSLEAILNQSEDNAIQQLEIKDYSNTEVRGFIEGYYGIPWSYEDRKSLMEFGGDFKTNTYIYAPKDDPYHRDEWDELYPEKDAEEIGKLAETGRENKTELVWSISPLGEAAETAQEEGDEAAMDMLEDNKEKVLEKFDQMYDEGVRQFGVLGDDVGALPLDYVVELMDAVSEWADEKGDVKDTIYTPAAYNSDWAWDGGEELNKLEESFDDNVHILWTGASTVGPVEQDTIDDFKNLDNNDQERRDPLFWLNWPVNDVDMTRVFLGKGDMLETGIEDLAGVVTNPMQEAEASKVSIFAIADYAWNTEDFDDQQSWEDSMKYIEPEATEAFHTLAKHMAHAEPEDGLAADESEAIKGLLDKTISRLDNDQSLDSIAPDLIDELQGIADASDEFMEDAANEELKKELEPFVNALHDMVLADIEYVKTQQALDDDDAETAEEHYEAAQDLREQSLDYDRPMLEGEDDTKAKPAAKRLQPFTDDLQKHVMYNINEDADKAFTDINKNSVHFEGINALTNEEIIDGYPVADGKKEFRPYESLSRVHSAVLLTRALDLPGSDNTENVFKDVSTDDSYAEEIAAVKQAEIFEGNDGYFNGDQSLTREQMATVLVDAYGLEAIDEQNGDEADMNLENVDKAHRDSVQILANLELTDQLEDFHPQEKVTRGQFATFLHRAMK